MAEQLPDAGISSRDVVVDSNTVRVTVHNIGIALVESLMVVLYDGERELDRVQIQNLEAPLDLLPRTKDVVFSMGSTVPDSVTVVIDPEQKLDEITRANNRVSQRIDE